LIRRDALGRLVSTTSVWFEQDWSEPADESAQMERCVAALRAKRRRLREEHDEHLPIDGLLVLTGRRGSTEVALESIGGQAPSDPMVVVMRIPPDLHRRTDGARAGVEDARAGFDLVLERLLGAA
jgi:hypothetical protein